MANNIDIELKEYKHFKENFEYVMPDIVEKNGMLYCENLPIYSEKGTFIGACEKWIDVGYKINCSLSKLLSNLYPYEFEFRGFRLKSIESCFQGLKFPDPDIQKLVFGYWGVNAYHLQAASMYNWKESGILYWQGKSIDRNSKEYEDFVDELYISAIQNPFYRQSLKNVDRLLIHSIGKLSKTETVLTRYEYEKQINGLSSFLKR